MPVSTQAATALQAGDALQLLALVIPLLITLVTLAGMWTTFVKARKPGWAAIIPLYNLWVLIQITDNEWWWFLLFLIPIRPDRRGDQGQHRSGRQVRPGNRLRHRAVAVPVHFLAAARLRRLPIPRVVGRRHPPRPV